MLVAICLAIPQRMRLSGTVTEIWRLKDNGVTTLTFWGQVMSSATWPFDSRRSISYGWSIVTKWPCVYLAPLLRYGRLKFFQESSSRNSGRSSISHWSHVLLFTTLGT